MRSLQEYQATAKSYDLGQTSSTDDPVRGTYIKMVKTVKYTIQIYA